MPASTLLIDAMGTLLRLLPASSRLRIGLRERFGVQIGEPEAAAALAAEISYYRAHMHEGRDAESVAALHRACGAALAGALPALAGVDPEGVTATLLEALRFEACADARPALYAVRSRGLRVIVVSNWDASLPDALDASGLSDLVDGVVSSGAAGVAKPAPEIFARALALAGAAAGEAVHVGDSLSEDVAGARAAGIAALWLNRAGVAVPAGVHAIPSLAALDRALREGGPLT